VNILEDLKNRGLIKDTTSTTELDEHLDSATTLYCGFDPTADSLHVGSLLPLITLLRFKKMGHNPLALIGGATGMIGDPSGKSTERNLQNDEMVSYNRKCVTKQIQNITNLTVVDNFDWVSKLSILDFLRDTGKHFSINNMIRKDSVKKRIERSDQGISFTEFSYMLFQSLDFSHLNKTLNCTLQIGGSDQWGNITAGIDLIHKQNKNISAFGITIPLLTKNDGSKFGKSESGNVWLDSNKTSVYEFFQFWLHTEDSSVYTFLKQFTFLSIDRINEIKNIDTTSNKKPIAQEVLATEITKIVHGENGLSSAKRITDAFFSSDFSLMTDDDFSQIESANSVFNINKTPVSLVDLLVSSGLASSKRQSREFIKNNAVSINGSKIIDVSFEISKNELLFNRWLILKRGKKSLSLIKLAY
jgi:tyrosyl-tRNA synthetase